MRMWGSGDSPHSVESANGPCEVTFRPSQLSTTSTSPQTSSRKPPANLLTSFPENGPIRAMPAPDLKDSAPLNTGGTGVLVKYEYLNTHSPWGVYLLNEITQSWAEGELWETTGP